MAERATLTGDQSLRLLSLVSHTVTQRIEDALKVHGSDIDQWRILGLLVERGACPMNVIAEHAMLLAPKLSKVVDRMVSANLVLRRPDAHDRRRVLVAASPRGQRAFAEWDAATAQVQQRFHAALGDEAPHLQTLLTRLHESLTD
ncbi:MarR family winged helix-turn-helix transcriptional regulator [Pseudonocardia spinosispora]|uniref:MarR family winged helix-turn-helix transcriptional regulator n=1 Tax=Pseudonocardia spinosispora TaxID=103441 RepID=UPI000411B0BC|nr:MarR family winged helix-turn-helix transcriptional regulator [Pseudonocardia spinosispora]